MRVADSKWHVLFEGSGSVTGNGWCEEVCYLGDDQWLLSLSDDPAWSGSDRDVQEPEARTSASLVDWVFDMEQAGRDEDAARVRALLEIAEHEGALGCAALIRARLDPGHCTSKDISQSPMAKAWASVARIRAGAPKRRNANANE